MTTKEQLARVIEDLPDDATIEDAMERLLFLAKVEKGIQQANAGKTLPHEKEHQPCNEEVLAVYRAENDRIHANFRAQQDNALEMFRSVIGFGREALKRPC